MSAANGAAARRTTKRRPEPARAKANAGETAGWCARLNSAKAPTH